MMATSNCLALTYNEITTIDNVSWINVHAYMMVDWDWVPILISLEHVTKCRGNNNLIKVMSSHYRKIVGSHKKTWPSNY
jgi:hypothetical protein